MINKSSEIKIRSIRQGGFTLIELIIAIGLLSIVTGAIFSFQSFGTSIFNKSVTQSDIQASLRLTSDFIVNEVRNATEIRLSAPPTPNDYYQIYVSGNKLNYKPIGGIVIEKTDAIIKNPTTDLLLSLAQIGSKYTLKFSIKGTSQKNSYAISSDVLLNNIKLATTEANSQVLYYKKAIAPPAAVPVNAQLDTLSLTFGSLSPIFNSAHTTYIVRLPFNTVIPPQVNGIAKPDAVITNTIQVVGVPGTAKIYVSSLDGTSSSIYIIKFELLPPPVQAVALSVTGNLSDFTVVFDKNIGSVTSKPTGTQDAQINVATVQIAMNSGNFSNGNHSITVTDLDGLIKTVSVNKQGSNWTFP